MFLKIVILVTTCLSDHSESEEKLENKQNVKVNEYVKPFLHHLEEGASIIFKEKKL